MHGQVSPITLYASVEAGARSSTALKAYPVDGSIVRVQNRRFPEGNEYRMKNVQTKAALKLFQLKGCARNYIALRPSHRRVANIVATIKLRDSRKVG